MRLPPCISDPLDLLDRHLTVASSPVSCGDCFVAIRSRAGQVDRQVYSRTLSLEERFRPLSKVRCWLESDVICVPESDMGDARLARYGT